MIEYLKGELIKKEIGHVILLTGGVGYGVAIPLSAFEALPREGEQAALWIYHHTVDGESHLFGFAHPEGRAIFSILLTVSGVGPKLALKMMSSMTTEAFAAASLEIDPISRDLAAASAEERAQGAEQIRQILARHNLDGATYNAIATRAQTDQALQQRIASLRPNQSEGDSAE